MVYTDEKTGAETKYIEAELTYNRKLLPFSESAKFAKGGYVKNIKSGKVWAVSKQTTSTDRYGGVHDVHVATGVGYSRHNIPSTSCRMPRSTRPWARKLQIPSGKRNWKRRRNGRNTMSPTI